MQPHPTLTSGALANAYATIAHPDARQPQTLRRWAWAVLKAQRCESISQTGLNRLDRVALAAK